MYEIPKLEIIFDKEFNVDISSLLFSLSLNLFFLYQHRCH